MRVLLPGAPRYHRRLTVKVHGDSIEYLWGPLRIAAAQRHDVPLVLGILDEAAERLQRLGIDQWRPGAWTHEELALQAGSGEVFLAWFGTEAAGTLALQWQDKPFWGEQPPDAGYVHRLALPDRWIGTGLGKALLEWSENRVRTAGRQYLRLDCMAENPRLRAYYEGLGFRLCREIGSPRWRAALYEKRLWA